MAGGYPYVNPPSEWPEWRRIPAPPPAPPLPPRYLSPEPHLSPEEIVLEAIEAFRARAEKAEITVPQTRAASVNPTIEDVIAGLYALRVASNNALVSVYGGSWDQSIGRYVTAEKPFNYELQEKTLKKLKVTTKLEGKVGTITVRGSTIREGRGLHSKSVSLGELFRDVVNQAGKQGMLPSEKGAQILETSRGGIAPPRTPLAHL